MKKTKIISTFTFTMVFLVIGLMYSCSKNSENIIPEKQNDKTSYAERKRFHIFYAAWDEWGRTSRGCKGWGICNATSCWFCCVDEGIIVKCNEGKQKVKNAGKVIIDPDTNEGDMYIELDPLVAEQKNAIDNSLILYVDEDIQNDDFIIRSGEYHFSQSIGAYGGYKVSVTKR